VSRTNIPVSDAVYDQLADHKAEGETWDDILEQAADALDEDRLASKLRASHRNRSRRSLVRPQVKSRIA